MGGSNVLVTTNTILEPGKTLLLTFKLTAKITLNNNISNVIAIPYTGGEVNLMNNSTKTNVTTL